MTYQNRTETNLNRSVTSNDIKEIINNPSTKKRLGPDRLTVKFHQTFKKE
jgi:hypothetical protein